MQCGSWRSSGKMEIHSETTAARKMTVKPLRYIPLQEQVDNFSIINIFASEACSSVVSALASGARGLRFDSHSRLGKFWCPYILSLVLFAGMSLNKCIILRI